jgi:hypothetical protein
VTAFTAQHVDLSRHVEAGGRYLLRIEVRSHRGGRPIAPHWAEWCECIARGIFRSVSLGFYPEVRIADVFVRTSVQREELRYDVWLANGGKRDRELELSGSLTSWNGAQWPYPGLPVTRHRVPAGQTVRVSSGPMAWKAGRDSYWWPNIPYRVGYRCQLHRLELLLRCDARPDHRATTRFGFRELEQRARRYVLNGVPVNFRGDNLQVANYDRIDHGGRGDAIDTLPGLLPPSAENPGWPKAVDNFLRLNYNTQRAHMGPWAPYMLDVCDEMGLMLVGESASRWNGFDMENGRGFHETKCLRDIVLRDRNHASILRWSLKNEAQCLDPAYHRELYDAVKELDDTRPMIEEIVIVDRAAFDVDKVFALIKERGDFTWLEHYLCYRAGTAPRAEPGTQQVEISTTRFNDAVISLEDRPWGIGEANWARGSTAAGLTWFATLIALGRARGASDMRPYVLLSSWASSIPGVRTEDFLTEENRHPVFGEDTLPDPWSHPGIRLLQQSCHPLLAMDYEHWWINREGDPFGHFPSRALTLPARATVTRRISVFNDELAGDRLRLRWEVREGHPNNRLFDRGSQELMVPLGGRTDVDVAFQTPRFNTYVFVTLMVEKDGELRFSDALTHYEVSGGDEFRSELNGEERVFL